MHLRRYIYLAVFQLLGLGFATSSPQEDARFLEKAKSLHYSGNFVSASQMYALAIVNGAQYPSVFIDAAACFAAIENRDTAFYFLDMAIQKGWGDLYWIEHDEQLTRLHDDRRWASFLANARAKIDLVEASLDASIRRELFEMRFTDQKARRDLLSTFGWLRGNYRLGFLLSAISVLMVTAGVILVWRKKSRIMRIAGYASALVGVGSSAFFLNSVIPSWGAAMIVRDIDQRNTERMKDIIQQAGWPGKSLVGEDGAEVAWLLVQHADHDIQFQKNMLPLIEEAAKKGEATFVQATNLRVRVQQKER
ncbi:MAG: DUF6624 domain-containing protein [Bacteroidota bacterium]